MKRRIFVALNLPPELRVKLREWKSYLPGLEARWIKPENIHLTLVFIGYVLSPQLEEIIRVSKETALRHAPVDLTITKIHFGPPHAPPRMVWAEIAKNEALARLQRDLSRSLHENSQIGYGEEARPYSPHLTLSRFDPSALKRLTPQPTLNEEIHEKFNVTSLDIMESKLARGGAEYSIVRSLPLNNR